MTRVAEMNNYTAHSEIADSSLNFGKNISAIILEDILIIKSVILDSFGLCRITKKYIDVRICA